MDYRDLRAACLAGDANKARRVVEELLLRAGAPWTRAR
jgi:DNA-binding FadR family transcriptional regulator